LIRAEDKVAPRSEYSFGHTAFDDFLYACVGEEKNGTELTVLSALTRLGFDPWVEAARLSDLPEKAATQALATIVAGIPEGNWKISDSRTIAARLMGRLPGHGDEPVRSSHSGSVRPKARSTAALWLICIVFAAALLFAAFDRYAGHGVETNPGSVSSEPR
jgi:hypothetical protein